MKRYFFTSVLIASMSLLASCNDWIEENNFTPHIATATFYNTPDEAHAAVMAPLNVMRSAYNTNWFTSLETDTEYVLSKGVYTSYNRYEGVLDNTHRTRSQTDWTNIFKAILYCNMGIRHIPGGVELTDVEKASFVAELRFIRAYNYFSLVRRWGGVPIRTEETMEEWNIPRASAQEVYNLILSDLEFALTNVPATPRMIGTPGRNAVKTLLAEVCMYTGDYNRAATLSGEVVNSGAYSLVPVSKVRDFDKVFGYDLPTSTEEVFYIKTSRTDNRTWGYLGFTAHPQYEIEPGKLMLGGSTCYFTHYSNTNNPVVEEWARDWHPETQTGDMRYDLNLRHFIFGADTYGPYTMLLTKYWDPNTLGGSANVNIPLIRFTDAMVTYAEATARVAGAPTAASIEMLNQMRRRGRGLDYKTPAPEVDYRLADYATMDKFIELLVKEEMYERMNEGKHWFFIVRLGKAAERVKACENRDINNRHWLLPIPDNEFNYNSAIDPAKDQNPGYEAIP